jgi:hypothetical protein
MMTRGTRLLFAAVAGCLIASPARGRDPGEPQTRTGAGRTNTPDGLVPERIDPSELHPPSSIPRREPPLYERVESDVDRGTGRIEDEQTYELRRLQRDREERLGRIPPRREFDRLQQDLDRRDRIERRDKSQAAAVDAARRSAARDNRRPEPLPQPMGSTVTRWVAQQSKLLDAARVKYQADLAAAEAERDDALRSAKTREARAEASRLFDRRRADLTRTYQQYCKKVLGTD